MLLYLDTSNLVKLYVEEEDSTEVANLVVSSKATATSLIAYAESRSAFARRYKEKAFTRREYEELITSFNADWENYLILRVQTDVVMKAGYLAEKHGLRGFDAIHLSSALRLKEEVSEDVVFSCSDRVLQKAAHQEGLHLPVQMQ
jgi:predicted nucleic acid-binding protein